MTAQSRTTGSTDELHGRRLRIHNTDNRLVSNGYDVTSPAVVADVTISAEAATVANQRDITIALKDSRGNAITAPETVGIWVMADAEGLDITATGGNVGIAENSVGQIIATVVAKKYFICRTTAAGLLNLKYTDTGSDTAFLGVQLPNGRLYMIGALTNAP